MFWYGAFEAIELQQYEIGWNMLRILRKHSKQNPDFLYSISDITYQEVIFRILGGVDDAIKTIQMIDIILISITSRSNYNSNIQNSNNSNITSGDNNNDHIHKNNIVGGGPDPNNFDNIIDEDFELELLPPEGIEILKRVKKLIEISLSSSSQTQLSQISTLLTTTMHSNNPLLSISGSSNITTTTYGKNENKGDEEFNGIQKVWGVQTIPIMKEISRFVELIRLPSLNSLLYHKKKTALFTKTSSSSSIIKQNDHHLIKNNLFPTILKGSLLPVANLKLKQHLSVITERKIQGTSVKIQMNHESDETINSNSTSASATTTTTNKTNVLYYAGVNEVHSWKRVNPFSPLFTGDIL